MRNILANWMDNLVSTTLNHPRRSIIIILIVTVLSFLLASMLELRMNWTDLLPKNQKHVETYREVQERFGEFSLAIVLEGEYDDIVALAKKIGPPLHEMESLEIVQDQLPVEFIRDHGFVLIESDMIDRSLKIYDDRSLVGYFNGLNNDFETEYTNSEQNLKKDEVDLARNLLGLSKALENLRRNLAIRKDAHPIENAVDAVTIGDQWMVSLDRKMLLILVEPVAQVTDVEATLQMVEDVEFLLDRYRPAFPNVDADLTGMSKISQDEMNSVGIYTQFLTLFAFILIYFLLARSFRSWIIPVYALLPLGVGIVWTMAFLQLVFGGLNLFTAMIMIVLLGIGIDFSIHLISAFREEIRDGASLEDALTAMYKGSGVGVITGAITSAAAFFTLMIGETRGVIEFGAAAGSGVIFTLLAILFVLPLLLARYYRKLEKSGKLNVQQSKGKKKSIPSSPQNILSTESPFLGRIAAFGWRVPIIYLLLGVLIIGFSVWATKHIGFEYDMLELEPEGLRSVELQRQIPDRFGFSDHAAWTIAESVEESRRLKKAFEDLPSVAEVTAISDFLPPSERIAQYTPKLKQLRTRILQENPPGWKAGDDIRLHDEFMRLWDNLDLMSNLAYVAGLDRIVTVIDDITGTVNSKDSVYVDSTASLPSLTRILSRGIDPKHTRLLAEAWGKRMQTNLYSMADTSPITQDDLPRVITGSLVPKTGDGYLVHVRPRESLWSKTEMERFTAEVSAVDEQTTGTEQLFLVMMDATLKDGKKAALFALLVIAIVLLIHFRGPFGLLAMVPLASGAFLMVGLMWLLDMKYNYMNLIAVPIILGIGIDDGIHALHRFRRELGTGAERVKSAFSHVGRAILLTSLTTMIGFGNVAFYEMRGMASFGIVLFMGVGACFLTTIFILPPLLRLLVRE
ncbi:MMPL family transporter [bacterium]|nr:MMPL family transporter [bacterium]